MKKRLSSISDKINRRLSASRYRRNSPSQDGSSVDTDRGPELINDDEFRVKVDIFSESESEQIGGSTCMVKVGVDSYDFSPKRSKIYFNSLETQGDAFYFSCDYDEENKVDDL